MERDVCGDGGVRLLRIAVDRRAEVAQVGWRDAFRGTISVVNEKDLVRILAGFHREVVLPDVARAIQGSNAGLENRLDRVEKKLDDFRSETLTHFDDIYVRLDRIQDEYQALNAALKRLELAFEEDRAERKTILAEIEKIKLQIADLQERVARLETDARRVS